MEKMSRREAIYLVGRGVVGGVIIAHVPFAAACIPGFEPVGEPMPGVDGVSVHEALLIKGHRVYWIDRRHSGREADGSLTKGGPRIVEIEFPDGTNPGRGEFVYMIDDTEVYDVGAHNYFAGPHQTIQMLWGPPRRELADDELQEPGMPDFDRDRIDEIERNVGFYGQVG